jgi:chromosome segregation ATPase
MSKTDIENSIWQKIDEQKKLAKVYDEIKSFEQYGYALYSVLSESSQRIDVPDQSKFEYASDAIENMNQIVVEIKEQAKIKEDTIKNIKKFKQELELKMHSLENEARKIQDNYNQNNTKDSDYGIGIQITNIAWNWK